MIPFARMLEYGNDIVQVQIRKALGGTNSAFILYDDGRLFGAGSNTNAELGLGNYTGWNGATPKWTLIQEDVLDVWAGKFAYGVVTKVGSELYYTGNANARNISGTTSFYYTRTSLNLVQAIGVNFEIVDVCMNRLGIFVLVQLDDGTRKIYVCGNRNYIGTGGVGSTDMILSTGVSSTDILQIGCTSNAFYYLTSSGELYGTGINASNQLSTDATNKTYTSYERQGTQLFDSFSTGNTNYIAKSGSSLYCRGLNNNHAISSLNITPLTVPTLESSVNLLPESNLVGGGSTASVYINGSTEIYGIGLANSMIPGASTVTEWTMFDTKGIDFSNYNSSNNNSFYGSGYNWYMVNSYSTVGIVGDIQSNGSFKLPLTLT